ncbi:MAG: hypothetical protein Q4E73_05150 [Lachnospiraceae bacterium]|nr:hypothetical protein [Lachnospiraceae bacterium]
MEHNIYDLKSDSAKAYLYCEESCSYIRRKQRVTLLCVIMLLAGGTYGIYLILNSNPFWYFLLFFCIYYIWILFLQLILYGRIAEQIRKKGNQQAAHDYNYDLYAHTRRKKKHPYLLAMAENQIKLGQFSMSEYALQMINRNELNKEQIYRYYLLAAIAAEGLGEWEKQKKYIEFCNMAESSGDILSTDMSREELIEKLGTDQKNMIARSRVKKGFLFMTYLTFSAFYFVMEWSLPETLEYRQWFDVLGHLLFWLVGILLMHWRIVKFCKISRKMYDSEFLRVLLLVLCILFGFGVTLSAGIFALRDLLAVNGERDNGDGTLTVISNDGYRTSQSYLYQKKGIFLREYIEPVDGTDPDQSSVASSVPSSTETTDLNTAADLSKENDILQNEQALSDAYRAVYKATGNQQEYELQYSAKGILYLNAKVEKAEGRLVGWRIVYDRESVNGKCSEFVYYKDIYDADGTNIANTEILNFYAYVHDEKKVITANKTNWGTGGDQEYREATGE